ncbi:MAG TPA: hypothetical protein VJ201_08985 [Candidatus Babeliales bacterium]|nr:hypothetical protein [Candidatus Babeliales bacterium]
MLKQLQKQLQSDLNNVLLYGSLTSTCNKSSVENDVLTLKKFQKVLDVALVKDIYKPRHIGKSLYESIFVMPYPTITVSKKVHRKKCGSITYHIRIQKKWNKRYGFITIRDKSVNVDMCYQTKDGTYVYPHVYDELKKISKEEKPKYHNSGFLTDYPYV